MNQLSLTEIQALVVLAEQSSTKDAVVREVVHRWPSSKSGPETVRAALTGLVAQRLVSTDHNGMAELTPSGVRALEDAYPAIQSLRFSLAKVLGQSVW